MSLSLQNLDETRVLVSYDFTDAEPERGPESMAAGPGSAAQVHIRGISIAGHELDASHFSQPAIDHLTALILAEETDGPDPDYLRDRQRDVCLPAHAIEAMDDTASDWVRLS
jgi:hypothetical protein